MKALIVFFQFIFFSFTIYSQVDVFKMRHESTTHQIKNQTLGEITQRATIIDTNSNPNVFQTRLIDLLEQNTELYTAKSAYSLINYYYRGQSLSNSKVYINNVAFSSNLVEGSNSIFNLLDFGNSEKTEILYGQNIALNNANSPATISLFINHKLDFQDSNSMYRTLKINYGNNSQFANLILENKFKTSWRNSFSFLIRQNNQYAENNTNYRYASERNYNFQNLIEKRLSDYNKLNFYFSTSISTSNQKLINSDTLAFISKNTKRISPLIFSYLQWSKSSDESKWYTQLISTFSYLNTTVSDSFEGNDNINLYSNFPTYTSNKISLQTNGYKNLGSRAVYYFGGELSAENIYADYSFSMTNNTSYFLPTPIIHSNFYFKKESRPSSDYSWIFGASIGVDQYNLQVQKSQLNTTDFLNKTFPNISIQASWTRHLCENSNYSINLFANYNSPKINQFIPLFSPPYYISNLELIAEKKINIEGNLYRKFDDKIELNFSTYYSLTRDAILIRDYNGEATNQVGVYGSVYGIQQNQNVDFVSNYGVDNEVKFHFTKHILIFSTIHIQNLKIHTDDKKYNYLQTPIYGNLGLKIKYKKLLSQLWLNYNLGQTDFTNSRYNSQLKSTTNYTSFHASASIQFYKTYRLQAKLDNIFNVNTFTYFSQISNLGRNGSVQMTMEF